MERLPRLIWIERINIVKVVVLSKVIYRCNTISIKIPLPLAEIEKNKTMLKFSWKHRRSQIAKGILVRRSGSRDTTVSDFWLSCRAIVTKLS